MHLMRAQDLFFCHDKVMRALRAAAHNFQQSCYAMIAAFAPAVMAGTMTAGNYASSLRRMTITTTGEGSSLRRMTIMATCEGGVTTDR